MLIAGSDFLDTNMFKCFMISNKKAINMRNGEVVFMPVLVVKDL